MEVSRRVIGQDGLIGALRQTEGITRSLLGRIRTPDHLLPLWGDGTKHLLAITQRLSPMGTKGSTRISPYPRMPRHCRFGGGRRPMIRPHGTGSMPTWRIPVDPCCRSE